MLANRRQDVGAPMKQFTDEQVDGTVTDAIRAGMTNGEDDLPSANEPPEMREATELARRS